MTIEIIDAVYPVDEHCRAVFVDIYNIIVMSRSIVELNNSLIADERVRTGPKLSAWFKWHYAKGTFILRQRTGFYSEICFAGRILEVNYQAFTAPDRLRTIQTVH